MTSILVCTAIIFSVTVAKPEFLATNINHLSTCISDTARTVFFCTYVFHRYIKIMPSTNVGVYSSGLSFGFTHIAHSTWIAVLISTIAGFLFRFSHVNSRFTAVVVIERTLWGTFAFTIGLGAFFLTENIGG